MVGSGHEQRIKAWPNRTKGKALSLMGRVPLQVPALFFILKSPWGDALWPWGGRRLPWGGSLFLLPFSFFTPKHPCESTPLGASQRRLSQPTFYAALPALSVYHKFNECFMR